MKLDFKNTQVAFEIYSTDDLKNAQKLYKLMGISWLMKVGKVATQFALDINLPVNNLIKKTVFKQFCGGETLEETAQTAQRIYNYGVCSVLDYSVEGQQSETSFDHTVDHLIESIQFNKDKAEMFPFAVFKPTGIGRFALYQKVAEGNTLTADEKEEWARILQRFDQIISTAVQADVRIMIDAEETWIQNPVDDIVLDFMKQYNGEKIYVYNTLQMYRNDRLAYLKSVHKQAEKEGFTLGFKIVRGAYMEKERERAKKMNYPSPINASKEDSDACYNQAVEYILNHLDSIALYAGTHNEQSTQLIADMMEKQQIEQTNPRVWFSQLYGMCDHISFTLSKAGYNICKYLPYGPVTEVMPYLLRRADENSSAGAQTAQQITLIKQELKRRKNNG